MAMVGGIFSPQLKGWLWMGLFSKRNQKSGYGWEHFLVATKRVALDEVIFWSQLKEWLWMGAFFRHN